MKKARSAAQKPVEFAYALRSFMGYLEGTSKSRHTISNYRLDVLAFERFLRERHRERHDEFRLDQVTADDVEAFHDSLHASGLKTNTRRRKLMTVRRFLSYLARRKKVPEALDRPFPVPHKIERIPFTVPGEDLLALVRDLPAQSDWEARNRVLLWTLAETGCQVSEVTRLKPENWRASATGAFVRIEGKAAREVPVSRELYDEVQKLVDDSPWLFFGFNKFGPLGQPITSRGVEMLVKTYAPKLGGEGRITPRTFRHSAVLRWFREGMTQDQIQQRLGLKTAYAFKAYSALLGK